MAILSPTEFPLVGVQFKMSMIKQAAQHDKVVFSDAGVQIFSARIASTGVAATVTYNTVTAANTAVISVATQSFTYGSATALARLAGNFYIQVDSEIMYVGKDTGYTTTTGVFQSLIRGALGTTPATHAATAAVSILNSINLGDSQTSLVDIVWASYPPDARAVEFAMT